jgi:hypothetical protein
MTSHISVKIRQVKMEAVCSIKTLVSTCKCTRRYNPDISTVVRTSSCLLRCVKGKAICTDNISSFHGFNRLILYVLETNVSAITSDSNSAKLPSFGTSFPTRHRARRLHICGNRRRVSHQPQKQTTYNETQKTILYVIKLLLLSFYCPIEWDSRRIVAMNFCVK